MAWNTPYHAVRFSGTSSHASQRPPHSWTAPAPAAFHRARPPLLRRRSRRPRHCWMAPAPAALHRARPSLLRRRSRHPRHCWMAPAPAALDRARPLLPHPPLLRRRSSRPAPWRMALMPAPPCRARRSPLRRRSRHLACPLTADRAARRPEQRARPRRLASLRGQACRARRSPLRRRSPPSACAPTADRPTHQPEQRHTRPAILPTAAANLRLGSTFPRRSGATSGYATVHAAVIAIRSPGGAAPLPICCNRPPVARRRGRWPGAVQPGSTLLCSSQNAPRLRSGCSAGAPDVAPPPRCWRAARLRWPTACRWPGGDTLRSPASRPCIFATASPDPCWSLSMRSCTALSWSPVNDFLPLPAFAPGATCRLAGVYRVGML